MNREQATGTIKAYFDSWLNRDIELFLSTLSDDVVIVECDSTTYRGIDRAHRWFSDWHAHPVNGRVTDWEILQILFDEANGVATVEWDFSCTCRGETSSFLGASMTTFAEGKIARVAEYRMDKAQHEQEKMVDGFLPHWFSGFERALGEMDAVSRSAILRDCGIACADSYTADLFLDAKRRSTDIASFLTNLAASFPACAYAMADDHTLRVRYSSCGCDLVQAGLLRSPYLCGCSAFNLKENVERALGVSVEVSMRATILRGEAGCDFFVTWTEQPSW